MVDNNKILERKTSSLSNSITLFPSCEEAIEAIARDDPKCKPYIAVSYVENYRNSLVLHIYII